MFMNPIQHVILANMLSRTASQMRDAPTFAKNVQRLLQTQSSSTAFLASGSATMDSSRTSLMNIWANSSVLPARDVILGSLAKVVQDKALVTAWHVRLRLPMPRTSMSVRGFATQDSILNHLDAVSARQNLVILSIVRAVCGRVTAGIGSQGRVVSFARCRHALWGSIVETVT